jgi:hypothetical protein
MADNHDRLSHAQAGVAYVAPAVGAGGVALRGFFATAIVKLQASDAAQVARDLARKLKDHSK